MTIRSSNIGFKLCPMSSRLLLGTALAAAVATAGAEEPVRFANVTEAAGLGMRHATTQTILRTEDICDCMDEVDLLVARAEILSSWVTGGVAADDYDGDGHTDLYVVGGDAGANRLFRNLGDKTFEDVTAATGTAVVGERSAGAVFADYDGDGDLDLFVGGALGTRPRLFRAERHPDATVSFTDVLKTALPTLDVERVPNSWGGAFGDYDRDGDLDLFIPHSSMPYGPILDPDPRVSTQHLWRNEGDGSFRDVSVEAGISALFGVEEVAGESLRDQTFSPNFVDLDEDGWLDLVVAGDIGTSRVLLNRTDGTFANATDGEVISGRTGMGTAIADFDNDGHFDWFVSHVRYPDPLSGNRLYRGFGDGTFEEVTAAAGVRNGHWGWASCFADFDNDGHVDLFHVNGFYHVPNNPFTFDHRFIDTTAVLFMADGDGTFTENAARMGLSDGGEGRGVSCFDYDRDGDVDLAISNHRGPVRLWENQGGHAAGFLNVRLAGRAPNTAGIGARIRLSATRDGAALADQVRLLRAGSNFVSSDAAEAHFGLGGEPGPFALEVRWPQGPVTELAGVTAGQFMVLAQAWLALTSETVFHEDAPGEITAVAEDALGHDVTDEITWSLGTRDAVVGAGPRLDVASLSLAPGRHPMFISIGDAATETTYLAFDLVIETGCGSNCHVFSDGFESGDRSAWTP